MKMVWNPGDLPWMVTLISKEDGTEHDFYETEREAWKAAERMVKDGVDKNSAIYVSRIVAQLEH